MIYVGIDVSKNKSDCFVTNENGEVLADVFTIKNDYQGFEQLNGSILNLANTNEKVKIGLEATGHYSDNIRDYLFKKGYEVFLLNPLQTNLYRKSLSLRKTKTDKIDACTIAKMLMSNLELAPYSKKSYHNAELKSLSRYRNRKVQELSRLKISFSRLITLAFPELEDVIKDVNCKTCYEILYCLPSVKDIANCHLTKLTNIIIKASKGKFRKEKALIIKNLAKKSVGVSFKGISLEITDTIDLIRQYKNIIKKTEKEIQKIMKELDSPILSIPGMGYRMAAIIISEIEDFSKFSSPDKILAYAGISPSIHQSGKLENAYPHMEKRGSKYLRYALLNSAKYVAKWDDNFAAYLEKKRAEGKHYNVAVSHVAKKLVRLIFALEKSGAKYEPNYAA